MHHGNRFGRKLQAGVKLGYRRVIPLLDLAQINIGQHGARDFHLARFDSLDVDDGDHAAHDHRPLHQAFLGQFVRFKRHVGRAEINRFGLDLLDAAARPDGLIVEADPGVCFIGLGPFAVNRVREASTRSGDFGSHRKAAHHQKPHRNHTC